jgi:predicted deacylase
MKNSPFKLFNLSIEPGDKVTLALPTPQIYTCAPMHIPIHVLNGKKKGPVVVVCAAIHGDETNGVIIVQKLLEQKLLKSLSGTLIAIPVVNVFGLIDQTRNLPDKRDLEKSFPGTESGSFASRLANVLNKEVFQKADYCIDLHTGEPHINRLPQIYTRYDNEACKRLADAFRAPVILNSKEEISLLYLMSDSQEKKIPTLLFEAGEALRLDNNAIKSGLSGIIGVLRELEMLPKIIKKYDIKPLIIQEFHSINSPGSGICRVFKKLGAKVSSGELIAEIRDPFGTKQSFMVYSDVDGIIIGLKSAPLVNEGETIIDIAKHKKPQQAMEQISGWEKQTESIE